MASPMMLHGIPTGGAYACSQYEQVRREGAYAEAEATMLNVRMSLLSYRHGHGQWSNNHKFMVKSIEQLRGLQNGGFGELIGKLHCKTKEQLNFIVDAWAQIVTCRRVLKWSYAYGYFLQDQERVKVHFEYLFGKAEG